MSFEIVTAEGFFSAKFESSLHTSQVRDRIRATYYGIPPVVLLLGSSERIYIYYLDNRHQDDVKSQNIAVTMTSKS